MKYLANDVILSSLSLISRSPSPSFNVIAQNFCGDGYVGCCDFGQECNIDCIGTLVAGCVQPNFPTTKPSVSPTLRPTISSAPSISDQPSPFPTVSMMPSVSPRPTGVPLPPSEEETPAPTPGFCTIEVNLALCSNLTSTQEYIPGCDCYVSIDRLKNHSHNSMEITPYLS